MITLFKTNVQHKKEAALLAYILGEKFPGYAVSFDLSDCDRVMRIKGADLPGAQVVQLLRYLDYECELWD